MSEIEELYENFPTILKEKLRNKEIEFPSNTKFDYEKIYVYRAVSREITDFHEIDKNDFRSYFELGVRLHNAHNQQPFFYEGSEISY